LGQKENAECGVALVYDVPSVFGGPASRDGFQQDWSQRVTMSERLPNCDEWKPGPRLTDAVHDLFCGRRHSSGFSREQKIERQVSTGLDWVQGDEFLPNTLAWR
jgi:hypothetical protein